MASTRTPYFFYVFKDTAGQWRWRFYAPNNRIVAASGEGYINRDDCVAAINLVANHSQGATIQYA